MVLIRCSNFRTIIYLNFVNVLWISYCMEDLNSCSKYERNNTAKLISQNMTHHSLDFIYTLVFWRGLLKNQISKTVHCWIFKLPIYSKISCDIWITNANMIHFFNLTNSDNSNAMNDCHVDSCDHSNYWSCYGC